MKIYTLVGKSGTGKSHHALNYCKENNIEAIIDDGLLIYDHQIVEGISAKKQETAVGAIKTAMFTKEEHLQGVKRAIAEIKPNSLLVLGTSENMVEKIVKRLNIGEIDVRVYIEEITTEAERAIARKQRDVLGKHIIPVPIPQLKRDFAGYFLDTLRIIRGSNHKAGEQINEKTVVRPSFSYMGDFYISEKAITNIAEVIAASTEYISVVHKTYQNTVADSFNIEVTVNILWGLPILEAAAQYQIKLKEAIEHMTAFNVVNVDIIVREIEKNEKL